MPARLNMYHVDLKALNASNREIRKINKYLSTHACTHTQTYRDMTMSICLLKKKKSGELQPMAWNGLLVIYLCMKADNVEFIVS